MKTAVNMEKVAVADSPPLPWSPPEVAANQKTSKELMEKLNALKQAQKIPLLCSESMHNSNLKLPTPIFIFNLSKSGTQTLTGYFKCCKIGSSHTHVQLMGMRDFLHDNFLADMTSIATSGVDPMHGCNEITKMYWTGTPILRRMLRCGLILILERPILEDVSTRVSMMADANIFTNITPMPPLCF